MSRLRGVGAAVFVAAFALSTGVVTAVPAGAAAGTSCRRLYGVAKFTPALPQSGSTTKVKTTITIKGAHVGMCSGGRVYNGTFDATLTAAVAGNCKGFAHGNLKIKGPATITWSDGGRSVIAAARLTPLQNPYYTVLSLTGKVSERRFAGASLQSDLRFFEGGCGTGPMKSAEFRTFQMTIG